MLSNLSVIVLDSFNVTSVPLAVVSIPSVPFIPNEIPSALFNETLSVEVELASNLIVFDTALVNSSLVAISLSFILTFPLSAFNVTSPELSFNTNSGVVTFPVAVTFSNVGDFLNPISTFPSVTFVATLSDV